MRVVQITPDIRRKQLRLLAGFALVSALIMAAGMWAHSLDRRNPANDQPVTAEVVKAGIEKTDGRFFVAGIARYSLDGLRGESMFVDHEDYESAEDAQARLKALAADRAIRMYCQRVPGAADPCALSMRLNLKVETAWALFAVLLGGALLFTCAAIPAIITYGRWAANRAPGWVGDIGFIPVYLVGIPLITALLFLFDWYWSR